MPDKYTSAHEIVAKGSEIYERKYRAEFERLYHGQFVAIEINSEAAYLKQLPEEALSAARISSPNGVFYLMRVGSAGAFKRRQVNGVLNLGLSS